jgi:hypothetical protein
MVGRCRGTPTCSSSAIAEARPGRSSFVTKVGSRAALRADTTIHAALPGIVAPKVAGSSPIGHPARPS